MKRLILLRHTKSSWASPDTEDFDRPLNKRGKRAAKALGRWFRDQALVPDLALVSAARRTRETWEGLGLTGAPEFRRDLYEAPPETIFEAVRGADVRDADPVTLLVIGHNPGLAEIARLVLAAEPDHDRFLDFPTGALLVAQFQIDSFTQLAPGTGLVEHFVTPHDLVEAE